MISPELLRRYPFFGVFNDAQLKEIAMISEEMIVEAGSILFKKGDKATALYVLIDGNIDLLDYITSEVDPTYCKEFIAAEMEPGSILAISALIAPFKLTATAKTTKKSRLIVIDGKELEHIEAKDGQFSGTLMHQVAKLALERMTTSRTLLAALMSQEK